MRLEQNQQAIERAAARGFESGANLDGMVAVIVDQRDAGDDALDLETAGDAGEIGQAGADQIGRDIQIQADGGSGSGVANIVNAGRPGKMEFAEVFAAIDQAEIAGKAAQFDVGDEQIGLAGRAVGNHRTSDARNDGLHVGLIEAQHDGAVERHAIDELREGILDFSQRAVVIEVFAIDGGDHGDNRRQQQEMCGRSRRLRPPYNRRGPGARCCRPG